MRGVLAGLFPAIVAVVSFGCGEDGSHPGSGPGRGGGTSGASVTHWRTALVALARASPPDPIAFDDAALARWSELLKRSWPGVRVIFERKVEDGLRQALLGTAGATPWIQRIRRLDLDAAAPPAVVHAGGGTAQRIVHELPAPALQGDWTLEMAIDLGTTIQQTIGGIGLSIPLSIEVTARASDLRLTLPLDLDVTDPRRPILTSAVAPQVALRLDLSSPDPLLQLVLGPLTQLLDPIVRAALLAGAVALELELTAAIRQLPQTPWGLGGPPPAPVSAPADLEALARDVSAEIQRHHMPYGTVLTTRFDQPGYGNGSPSGYHDYNDSAIWTGHYLAAEALRFDLTGDPRALAGARRAFSGLVTCLDVAIPADGLLSRCAVPLTSPDVASIRPDYAFFVGSSNGVAYGALENISRDQNLGTLLGFTQTYLRIPALRDDARERVSRIVGYLEGHDWNAYRVDGVTVSAPFAAASEVLWAVMKSGNLVDRGLWGAIHDRYRDLARLCWYPFWMTSRDVMIGYYKFNLMHVTAALLITTEADPDLYREYLKAIAILRDTSGHHQNAWFDVIHGMAVPSEAPSMGPRVESELQHWALRDRRAHGVSNSQDPAIAKAVYTSPYSTFLSGGTPAFFVAAEPLPIEKRTPVDFLWQRCPFDLDGGGDPHIQYPGVDLVLPYWAARSYGMIR